MCCGCAGKIKSMVCILVDIVAFVQCKLIQMSYVMKWLFGCINSQDHSESISSNPGL